MRKGIRLGAVWQLVAVAIVCSLIAMAAAPASAASAATALSPDSGRVGQAVTVAATNFAPSSVLTAKFDGTPLATTPATVMTLPDGSATFTIYIPIATAGVHTITISDSVNSAAANFTVEPTPKPAQDWAVIVGVSDYRDLNDLQYAHLDALDMYDRLTGTGWQPANIQLLLNGNATKANIQNAINWMGTNALSQDLCLFFFSGHGTYGPDVAPIDETDGFDEYICPYDSLAYSWGNDIRDDELDAWMGPITTRKVVIVDTCYGGGFFKGASKLVTKSVPEASYPALNSAPVDGFAKDINKSGFVVLAACDDNETSAEYPALQNGVFTYYLSEGLGGPADVNGNGVSAEEAFAYAVPRVQSYVFTHSGLAQDPQMWDGIAGEVILTPYTLTANSTAGGSVIRPGTGAFTFDPGTVVDLLALPDNGYKFVNWTGYVGTVADPYAADTTITMDSSYSITANFAESRPPTVASATATNVTSNSATLNGILYNLGSVTSAQVSFEWGDTANYGNETEPATATLPTAFGADLGNLTPGIKYHFRAKAEGDGTAYGVDLTFTIKAPPSVVTNAAGNMTAESAILNGNLTAMGSAASVTVSFEWGNTTSYGNETPAQVMEARGAFSGNITGLNPDTIYHFRAKAVGDGASYGNDRAFILNGSTPVTGITREIDGHILSGVTITLDGTGPIVSDQAGYYGLAINATGSYTLVAHKDGFRDRTEIVNIAGLGQEFGVTCNLQGHYGLIPNAPDMQYALICVNHWLFPPNQETGLDIWTMLHVINAWLYPVQ